MMENRRNPKAKSKGNMWNPDTNMTNINFVNTELQSFQMPVVIRGQIWLGLVKK